MRAEAAAAGVLRIAAAGAAAGKALEEESVGAERGDLGRATPLPFAGALRKGDAVRLTTGGVPVREGGLLGFLMVGLSQEEKKSSSGSPEGVLVSATSMRSSVMITSPGYLGDRQHCYVSDLLATYLWASRAVLLLSSSLYFVAALDVYLIFISLLASAAEPPCVWKYLVADSLPPNFMFRS